jgi:pimeloyl-ACP methyl ester carboxylesterase
LGDYVRGIRTSEDHFRDAGEVDDLPSLGTDFAVPFFVFQGEADHVTPLRPVRDYFESISAPRKEMTVIPNAGHNVMTTRSDEFLKLLRDRVRPLVSDL